MALFERIRVTPTGNVPPRSYAGYKAELPGDSDLPAGVTFTAVQG